MRGSNAARRRCVPALALARVDGLSPVEYLSEQDRSTVRRAAIAGLTDPPLDRDELIATWQDAAPHGGPMSATQIVRGHGPIGAGTRGRRPTVEVVVRTTVGEGRALAPAGASTGSGEAVDLRDGGERHGGLDVRRAIANVAD